MAETYSKLDNKIDKYLGTNNLRPGPPRKLVFKNNKVKEEPKIINYFSFSKELTKKINWDELISVKKSFQGSQGIYFLEMIQNRMLILKESTQIPSLLFGSLMTKAYGIETPSVRIIEYNDPEYKILINSMEKVSVAFSDIYDEIKNKLSEIPFFMILEYVPSLTLIELGPIRAEIILKESYSQSRRLFIDKGRILALDVFLNNLDRLPFVWSNNGNANNVLYQVDIDSLNPYTSFKDMTTTDIYIKNVVSIDIIPICLNPNDVLELKGLGDYLNKINEIFKEFFYEMKNIFLVGKSHETFEFRSMSKIGIFFKNSCGYQLSGKNIVHLAIGFITMMKDIIETDLKDIQVVIDFVQKEAIFKDWANFYKNNAKQINIEYFKYLHSFFTQTKEENEEIFAWVDDVTMGQYNNTFKVKLQEIIQFQKSLVFSVESDNKIKESTIKKENKTPQKQLMKEENKNQNKENDVFNYKENDKKKFGNDVHNGIFDVMEFDNSFILGSDPRKFNKVPVKQLPVSDYKELERTLPKPPIDPHKVYTIPELQEKIQRDELKDTLKIKKNFNPEEAEDMVNRIKASGNEDLLKVSKKNSMINVNLQEQGDESKSKNLSKISSPERKKINENQVDPIQPGTKNRDLNRASFFK